MQQLGQDDVDHKQRQVVIINQDSFYRPLTEEENARALKGEFNFDHPGTCTDIPNAVIFIKIFLIDLMYERQFKLAEKVSPNS